MKETSQTIRMLTPTNVISAVYIPT